MPVLPTLGSQASSLQNRETVCFWGLSCPVHVSLSRRTHPLTFNLSHAEELLVGSQHPEVPCGQAGSVARRQGPQNPFMENLGQETGPSFTARNGTLNQKTKPTNFSALFTL